jgi:hypothetical protein
MESIFAHAAAGGSASAVDESITQTVMTASSPPSIPLREILLRNAISITDVGVVEVLRAVGDQLTCLDFGKCPRLTEESAVAVGRYCSSVVELDLIDMKVVSMLCACSSHHDLSSRP